LKGWDEKLNEANKRLWSQWKSELSMLEMFEIDRCIKPGEFGNVLSYQLHHFCDASLDAYGTASYLRIVNENGHIHCAFMLGKSRLAPMRSVTIPRLELLAAVMAVKVDGILRREVRVPLSQSVFWTDSTTVLQYISNRTRRFKTFVANRVAIINDSSVPEQWRHVGSELNPADDASRGAGASDMLNKFSWKYGPSYLWRSEDHWPQTPVNVPDLLKSDAEVKPAAKCHAVATMEMNCVDELLQRYSSWLHLKRTVAWLRRFICWLSVRQSDAGTAIKTVNMKPRLEVEEMREAETAILKYIQKQCFGMEVYALSTGDSVSKSSSICALEPFKDSDGLIKVTGRLKLAPIPNSARHPIILPREHHVTELIVRYVHENECMHFGREYVLSVVRQKFWIARGRSVITKVLRNCMKCKRLHARIGHQRMAELPADRVQPGKPPFSNVGVDCFGPFLVKRGRSQEKRYGCLFTCMAIRAIHIEKLYSLDSDSFVSAFIRFTARRRIPELVRSDNGSNFVGGEKEIRDSIRRWNASHKLSDHMLMKEIVWKFNPPAASHMGGVWERQIRTVRKAINVVMNNQVLDDERLDTIFSEVESIVNGRPLTPVSDDPLDLEALTPNHLLLLHQGNSAPQGDFSLKDTYRRRWRHVEYLADQFWKRWLREYLPTLQLRQKWLQKQRNLEVGDIVMVADDELLRRHWPLGRVTATFPDQEGTVRTVEVKTAKNVLMRPIDKLCILEGAVEC